MKKNKSLVRGAGVLMAISSLPSDYGIGTMGQAAYSFIDLLADLKVRYWQILPIGPTSIGNSPYQPISAFAGNSYLIDLGELADRGLLTTAEIRAYDWGRDDEDIDYTTMYNDRVRILRTAFDRFDTGNSEYIKYKEDESYWLRDYVLFCTLKQLHDGREWTAWEAEYKDRDEGALDKIEKEHSDLVEFYSFCQFMFASQWDKLIAYAEGKGVSIIGDVPLYLAHDSADVWAHRQYFQLDADGSPRLVSAMPSDEFSPKGQIWGNPVYDWETMDGDGFSWWRSRIGKAAEMFNVIRLDHFIGAVKYYAVSPNAKSSDSGRWYKGPSRKFMEALMDTLGDYPIIVDDAGPRTVVPGVKKLIDKWDLTYSRILAFAWEKGTDNDNLPHNYHNSDLVVYTTTHDTETMTGYIENCVNSGKTEAIEYMSRYLNIDIGDVLSDRNDKEGLTAQQIKELADGCIRLAYSSPAAIAVIPIQDIFGLGNEARMNAPATVFGNWQWRVGRHSLTEERKRFLRDLAFTYRR